MNEPVHVAELLQRYGLRPKKGLGQNFLSDSNILDKIVAAGGVEPGDVVLEIGPGLGTLTRALAGAAREVIAVEIDAQMLGPLGEVLAPYDNVRVVHGDILDFKPGELVPAPVYKIVANIPYYITSAIVRHFLESGHPPQSLTLTVQREVAQRICAAPPRMSLLALSVQVFGAPEIAMRIPAGAFYPAPKVDSAVVRVDLYPAPVVPQAQLDQFFRLAKAGFGQKRKTLRNALSAGLGMAKDEVEVKLAEADIDAGRRAETLDMAEWGRLTEVF